MPTKPTAKVDRAALTLHGLRRTAQFYEYKGHQYRRILERSWGLHQKTVVMIGLNPSTADGSKDDPTIRADYAFCNAWEREHLIKLNLFDFCATEPKDMMKAAHPEGPLNWETFRSIYERPLTNDLLTVVCWGKDGVYRNQDWSVMKWLDYWEVKPMCLGYNANGTPKHPLYVQRTTRLQPFVW